MVKKLVNRNWDGDEISACILSTEPKKGSSGSAVFDSSGRLVSMIRGSMTYTVDGKVTKVENITVPLSKILNFYEKTFGEKVQYQ